MSTETVGWDRKAVGGVYSHSLCNRNVRRVRDVRPNYTIMSYDRYFIYRQRGIMRCGSSKKRVGLLINDSTRHRETTRRIDLYTNLAEIVGLPGRTSHETHTSQDRTVLRET